MKSIIESITPAQLAKVNQSVVWKSRTPTRHKENLGHPSATFYELTDWRVEALNNHHNLFGASVVELGCYEGAITVALGMKGALVTAIEGQADNLVCAMVRAGLHGVKPEWVLADLEDPKFVRPPGDVYFHCGVLYHLYDPLDDLNKSIAAAKDAILLDTHFSKQPKEKYGAHKCEIHDESEAPKNGLHKFSRWLSFDDLANPIMRAFKHSKVIDVRTERHGPRCTIIGYGGKRA